MPSTMLSMSETNTDALTVHAGLRTDTSSTTLFINLTVGTIAWRMVFSCVMNVIIKSITEKIAQRLKTKFVGTWSGYIVNFQTNKINSFGKVLQMEMPCEMADEIASLQKYLSKGKKVSVTIKRETRSKNANSALWHLIGEMSIKLRTTKEELYRELLKRYGVYTHLVAKREAVENLKKLWNGAVVELGEIPMRHDQVGVQLQVYYGSSTYDTQQFSRLLDGTISEAEEMGIYLISAKDRDLLLDNWSKRGEESG